MALQLRQNAEMTPGDAKLAPEGALDPRLQDAR
jgi:hypothetical protein